MALSGVGNKYIDVININTKSKVEDKELEKTIKKLEQEKIATEAMIQQLNSKISDYEIGINNFKEYFTMSHEQLVAAVVDTIDPEVKKRLSATEYLSMIYDRIFN